MTTIHGLTAGILLLTLLLGVVRVWLGPTVADRMLASQLFASIGIGLLLVLGELQQIPHMRDVALILALLSILATVAFISRVWIPGKLTKKEGDESH